MRREKRRRRRLKRLLQRAWRDRSRNAASPEAQAAPLAMEALEPRILLSVSGTDLSLAASDLPYLQSSDPGHMLVMEAESFHRNIAVDGKSWQLITDGAASAGEAMQILPDTNSKASTPGNSAQLSYDVQFTETGTHYLWILGSGGGNDDNDSIHAGLDGVGVASADQMDWDGSYWKWSHETMDGPVATIDVAAAGAHTIDLWMREDGFTVDKILLTTDSSYVPTGFGPDVSERYDPTPDPGTAEISGTTWADLDGDGTRGADEPGMAGVTVYLDANDDGILDWTDADGDGAWDPGEGEQWLVSLADDPATTDVDETGQYSFTGLASGDYVVRQVVPNGWEQTEPDIQMEPRLVEKLLASDAAAQDTFGSAVALDGNRAIVGARTESGSDSVGAAYILEWVHGAWVEQARLSVSGTGPLDGFGNAVALRGDWAVVGEYLAGDDPRAAGAAHVYHWDGAEWSYHSRLEAPTPTYHDNFGSSVAVDGERIVVGVVGEDTAEANTGGAYVFHWDGQEWINEAFLSASDAAYNDRFGESVRIDGNRIVVGAPGAADVGSSTGSAYVFVWDGASWSEQAKLVADDVEAGDQFGAAIAVEGDLLVVGAPSDDNVANAGGALYVYAWSGAAWEQQAKLLAADAGGYDFLGTSVAISDGRIIAGAPNHSVGGVEAGAAYVFAWDGEAWVQGGKVVAADGADNDDFGAAVAIAGDRVLVGSPMSDPAGYSSGSLYAFDYPSVPGGLDVALFSGEAVLSADLGLTQLPTPAAGAIDLAAESDTGESAEDGLTRRSNADAASTLTFTVADTLVGATVRLYARQATGGDLLLGSAVAAGSSTTITTDGVTALPDGPVAIYATQQHPDYLPQETPSAGELTIDVDTAAPAVTVTALLTDRVSPALSGTVDGGAVSIMVSVNGQWYEAAMAAVPSASTVWSLVDGTIADLPLGTYDVVATATDAAGNVGIDVTTDELQIIAPVGSISGTAWADLNASGTWDASEPGMAGVTVWIDASDDGVLDWTDADGDGAWDPGEGEQWMRSLDDDPATADVDETGQYSFTGISGGDYVVRQLVPDGMAQMQPDPGPESRQVAKLIAADSEAGDRLGMSVDIDGDRAIAGAFFDDEAGINSGSAYVFTWAGGVWREQGKLTPGDGSADDRFGYSVSVDGDRAVVGAYLDDDAGTDSGSAYVFVWDGSTWVEQAKLTASDAAAFDYFGGAVSVDGDRILVGASGDDDSGSGTGSAYVFRWDGVAWREETKLAASDAATDSRFGSAVALDGDQLVVGAPGDDRGATENGSAYVFAWDGSAFVEQAKLTGSIVSDYQYFGISVAIDGGRVVVGASGEGRAYAFARDGESWTEQAAFYGGYGTGFGASVAISGDWGVVGAHMDDGAANDAGIARVYAWKDGQWTEELELAASDAASDHRFGGSVALSGDRVVVGASYAGPEGLRNGAAYIFDPISMPGGHRVTLTRGEALAALDFGNARPPAPSPDLHASTDTGVSSDDNLTRLNNADAASALSFDVSGVVAGDTVRIYADSGVGPVEIGAGVASGETVTVTTSGAFALADGVWQITARAEDVHGLWRASGPMAITVDATAPVLTVEALVSDHASPALQGTVDDWRLVVDIVVEGVTYQSSGSEVWTLPAGAVAELGLGTYDIAASAMDAAGNVGFDASVDELEIVPPSGVIRGRVYNDLDASRSWDSSEPGLVGVRVWLDANDDGKLDWADADANGVWDPGEGEQWMLSALDDPETASNEAGLYEFSGLASGWQILRQALPAGAEQTEPNRFSRPTPMDRLRAADLDYGDYMGSAVHIDGDRMIVGALSSGPGSPDGPGAAYIYEWSGVAWVESARIAASDGRDDDLFGSAVAIDGDWAVVGAPDATVGAEQQGTVYLFQWDGSAWREYSKLGAADGLRYDRFGSEVALNDGRLLVGAAAHDGGRGAVYVYGWDGANWVDQGQLPVSGLSEDAGFGSGVVIEGAWAAVGVPWADGEGVVYLYEWDTGAWRQRQIIAAAVPDGKGGFGISVDMHGDRLVVGAYLEDGYRGAAYVFERSGSHWTQQGKLVSLDGEPWWSFGQEVAISGDRVVVSAPAMGNDCVVNGGAAYFYAWNGSAWEQTTRVLGEGEADYSRFGLGLDLQGDIAAIGHPGDRTVEFGAGSVHLYRNVTTLGDNSEWLLVDETHTGEDFGNFWANSIEGSVWRDDDGDGVADAGEPVMEGVTVFLDADADGELDAGEQSLLTDAAGAYSFGGLIAGDYTVAILPPTESWAATSPEGGSQTVSLYSGDAETGVSFGLARTTPFAVIATTPPAGGTAGPQTPTYTVTLADPVDMTTVEAGDLLIGTVPASSVSLGGTDGRTLVFSLPALAEGTHTVMIAADAITDRFGAGIEAFSSTFVYDATAPRVIATSISQDDVLNPGRLVYTVQFNEAMNADVLDVGDVTLYGSIAGYQQAESLAYDATTNTLTVTWDDLPEEPAWHLVLASMSGAFEDAAGNLLDGEASWPLPSEGSGDGTAGGNFNVWFATEITGSVPLTTWASVAPIGGMVYRGDASYTIGSASDSDSITANLRAGQAATFTLTPDPHLKATMSIYAPDGTLIGTTSASQSGETLRYEALGLPADGEYTITIASDGVTTGSYDLEVLLNVGFEASGTNESPETAQDLDPLFASVGVGDAQHAALFGQGGATGSVLFEETFASSTFDTTKWAYTTATIDAYAANEPTEPYAARLNGSSASGDELRSVAIDLSGETGVTLTYSWQQKGNGEEPDSGEDLVVSYLDSTGAWTEIARHLGSTAGTTSFATEEIALPADALHSNFQLRFSNYSASTGIDDWFVDDIRLTGAAPVGEGDWYRLSLEDGQALSAAVSRLAGSGVTFELYDADATTLIASSAVDVDDYQLLDFRDGTSDGVAETYLIRIVSASGEYSLVLLKDGTIESEPNGALLEGQGLNVTRLVIGNAADTGSGADTGETDDAGGGDTVAAAARLLVGLADAVSDGFSAASSSFTSALAGVGSVVNYLPSIGAAVVELSDPAMSIDAATTLLLGDASVRYVEPDYVLAAADTYPNDPSFSSTWGLHNTGQSGGTADADIDAPEVWDFFTGSSDVVVAVIDTGIDYTHIDLAANMWTNPGEIPGDGIDNDGNGYVDDIYGIDTYNHDADPWDDHYHGTHVAGTIGAVGDNGVGVAGVNWDVQLMALKFLGASGSGYTSGAVEALEYLTMMKQTYGVNVVVSNNSWGGGGYSTALYDAIEASNEAGVLFVAAAGNNGRNTDSSPAYPASYDLDGIISVAATDHNDALAYFSNYGATTVDLAAPGVNVYSTRPNNTYGSLSGTSMASPHVAGAAALLAAMNPSASIGEIKQALLDGVDQVASLAGDVLTGGRLNLANSVNLLGDPGDYYRFEAVAGDELVIETHTSRLVPAVAGLLADPMIELFDHNGTLVATNSDGAGDGFNARISYTATASGTYSVRVSAENLSRGDYLLTVSGSTAGEVPFTGQLTGVPAGGYVTTPPSSVTLTLDRDVRLDTIDASDLTVNGVAATGVSVVSANVLSFTLPALEDGAYTLTVGEGAMTSLSGVGLDAMSIDFTVDTVAPRIVGTSIQEGDLLAAGQLVYTVRFSETIDFDALSTSSFYLDGYEYSLRPTSLGYDESTHELSLVFSDVPEDRYRLAISSAVKDLAGLALDGEAVAWPIPPNQSGDGVAGGAFYVNFSVDDATVRDLGGFERLQPAGSLIGRTVPLDGALYSAADTDGFTLSLAEGEAATLVLEPTLPYDLAAPTFSVTIDGATYTAAAAGERLVIDLVGNAGGVSNIAVSGDGVSFYTLTVLRNAVVSSADALTATGQAIDGSLIDVAGGRWAVAGWTADYGETLTYSLDLAGHAGATLDILLHADGGDATFELLDTDGQTVLASGSNLGHDGSSVLLNATEALLNFTVPADGTYFIRVNAANQNYGDPFSLTVWANAAADYETAPSAGSEAERLAEGMPAVGYLSGVYEQAMIRLLASTPYTPALARFDPVGDELSQVRVLGTVVLPNFAYDGASVVTLFTSRREDGTYATVARSYDAGSGELIGEYDISTLGIDNRVEAVGLYEGLLMVAEYGQPIKLINLDTLTIEGTIARPADLTSSLRIAGAPSRGSVFMLHGYRGTLVEVDASTGEELGRWSVNLPSYSPRLGVGFVDGKVLLTVEYGFLNEPSAMISTLDPDTGELRESADLQNVTYRYLFLAADDPTFGGRVFAPPSVGDSFFEGGDVYSLALAEGETVTLRTATGLSGGLFAEDDLDAAIVVYGPDGTVVAVDSDSAADGVNALLTFTAAEAGEYRVQVIGESGAGEYLLEVNPPAEPTPASVVDRHVFYNGSYYDGNDGSANASDDGAIAPDKEALLPGQTATFANYTSYSRGINGIMIDVADLADAGSLTAGDFTFKVGNSNDPSTWSDAPAPLSVEVRLGAGTDGSDRVTIIWADGAIQKQWLQVTMLATDATGLAAADVHYWGNAIGETGDNSGHAQINAVDASGVRNNRRNFLNPASIDDRYDFNRDRNVNATDYSLVRNNRTNFLNDLNLIAAPQTAAVAPASYVAPLPAVGSVGAADEPSAATAQSVTDMEASSARQPDSVTLASSDLWGSVGLAMRSASVSTLLVEANVDRLRSLLDPDDDDGQVDLFACPVAPVPLEGAGSGSL